MNLEDRIKQQEVEAQLQEHAAEIKAAAEKEEASEYKQGRIMRHKHRSSKVTIKAAGATENTVVVIDNRTGDMFTTEKKNLLPLNL